jgi:RNA polymerase sigma-70 factor, ECF subfamily
MKKAEPAADGVSLNALLAEHREKLRRMIRCRMDRRLQGRVDPSDIIQETYVEAARRYVRYQKEQKMPFYLWLRFLTLQQLMIEHRRHLGARMRTVAREVSMQVEQGPEGNMVMLADALSGHFTSPSTVLARQEMQERLISALNALDPKDREVLMLRHFEQLNTVETAVVLGISEGLASTRYGRAVRKLLVVLKELFGSISEFRL